jgi:DNA-binding PadR family transcriptional regulator
MPSNYEETLLEGWESVANKSQLTLWILLALRAGPKQMSDIKKYAKAHTHGVTSADDKSMYRALRRFADADIVTFTKIANKKGPDLKQYAITPTGEYVLQRFIDRNIATVITVIAQQKHQTLGSDDIGTCCHHDTCTTN